MVTHPADVTIHIDETLDPAKLKDLRGKLLRESGVVGAEYDKHKPHLMIVEYDPGKNSSANLLKAVKTQGVHAELIGL